MNVCKCVCMRVCVCVCECVSPFALERSVTVYSQDRLTPNTLIHWRDVRRSLFEKKRNAEAQVRRIVYVPTPGLRIVCGFTAEISSVTRFDRENLSRSLGVTPASVLFPSVTFEYRRDRSFCTLFYFLENE